MLSPELITNYGYPAIFFTSIFEGEPVLILGGIAAQQGYIRLDVLMTLSFFAAIMSDSMFFLLGKKKGMRWLESSRLAKKLFSKPRGFLSQNPRKIAFMQRFMYGFRNIVPFSLGTTELPYRTFLLYNVISGIVWTLVMGLSGYFAGHAIQRWYHHIRGYELVIVIALILIGFGLHALYGAFKRRWAHKA